MGSCHSFLGLRGQPAQNMSVVEINATRMETEKFFLSLSEHLGTFTLGKTRPEGLDEKNSGSTRGEDRCGGGCLRPRHTWPSVRSLKDRKEAQRAKLKRLNLSIMTGFKHAA